MSAEKALAAAVAGACGATPLALERLAGGCIAEVYRVTLGDGSRLVAKRSEDGGLEPEAFMLRWLAAHSALPVPAVLHADDRLLLLDYVETSGGLDDTAQAHAAELLAALHDITVERFGFERDTPIGPLDQPNPWTASWVAFFRDQRLLSMGCRAFEAGRLPAATLRRLESFCGRLERYLEEPAAPALIHGDVWGGNVLVRGGRVAAFIDPAIHFAHPEVELAFSTLFGTFGPAFFRRYRELRPLAPGFFESRRDIYNLYPLLVHSRLFGGPYPAQVARILERFG